MSRRHAFSTNVRAKAAPEITIGHAESDRHHPGVEVDVGKGTGFGFAEVRQSVSIRSELTSIAATEEVDSAMSSKAFDPLLPVNTADRRLQGAPTRLRKVLPALCEFVRHDLAYREAVGDVAPGVLTADDIVDAVVLAAYRDLMSDIGEHRLVAKLRELAVQQIFREMNRVRANRGTVPVEGDVPGAPSREQETVLDQKILYFFEPEADLKTEDVRADPQAPALHAGLDTDELQRCLERAFKGMPPVWRRAILSRHIDGLAGEALARAVGRSVEEVRRMIDHARAYLREQLLEARSNGRTGTPD